MKATELIDFKHYIYNYLYHKSNIRLAGMMLDVELNKTLVQFFMTLPNVTSNGLYIVLKIKLADIVKDLEDNDDNLDIFCGKFYDLIMEQIINAENMEAEENEE